MMALPVRFQVLGADLQLVGSHFQHHLARLFGRGHDGVAHAVGGPAGKGAHAVGAGIRVGSVDEDVLEGQAQRFGRDLGDHGLEPLAQIGAGQRDDKGAGRGRVDQGLAWVATQVHTGRIVHGSKAGAS